MSQISFVYQPHNDTLCSVYEYKYDDVLFFSLNAKQSHSVKTSWTILTHLNSRPKVHVNMGLRIEQLQLERARCASFNKGGTMASKRATLGAE